MSQIYKWNKTYIAEALLSSPNDVFLFREVFDSEFVISFPKLSLKAYNTHESLGV